eukprot:3561275-Pyramimonas_sp.AAC.1
MQFPRQESASVKACGRKKSALRGYIRKNTGASTCQFNSLQTTCPEVMQVLLHLHHAVIHRDAPALGSRHNSAIVNIPASK